MLKKFPVVSKTNIEYLVEIYPVRQMEKAVEVCVYKTKKRQGWFGRVKVDATAINVDWAGGEIYTENGEWDYDYKAMAINEIIKYENSIKEKIEHEAKRKEGVKMFEEWDGKE